MDDASIYPEEVVISIHAPREGGDPRLNTFHHLLHLFQSTPPARGATVALIARSGSPLFISIHAPREGGDAGGSTVCCNSRDFNPRPPRGGRRCRCRKIC